MHGKYLLSVTAILMACRRYLLEAIRPVIDFALGDSVSHCAIPVEVHERAYGAVNGQLDRVLAGSISFVSTH